MKYCPYCGARMLEDMQFCPKCGKEYIDLDAAADKNEDASLNDSDIKEGKKDEKNFETTEEKKSETVEDKKKEKKPGKLPKALLIGAVLVVLLAAVLFVPGKNGSLISAFLTKPFSSDPDAIEQKSASVVKIYCYDKQGSLYATGSGFAMFESGVIVTNYHVVEQDAYIISAETEGGLSFPIDYVLAYDAEKDIAILKANADTSLLPLEYAGDGAFVKGEKVVAIGSPLGLKNSVSDGVLSAVLEEDGFELIQFTASISSGSSGGPLFNDKGQVMGITSASFVEGQNLNLAVPISHVCRLWEERDESKALTVEEFYDTFTHAYTVDYVLANKEQLKDQYITIEGYVSFTEGFTFIYEELYWIQRITLVNDKGDISGIIRTSLEDIGIFEAETLRNQGLEVFFPDYYMDMDEFLSTYAPGEYVEVYGFFNGSSLEVPEN